MARRVAPSVWKALYDFNGDASKSQLSFSAGDTFVVVQEHPGGWLTAQVGGKYGYIPSNYVVKQEGTHHKATLSQSDNGQKSAVPERLTAQRRNESDLRFNHNPSSPSSLQHAQTEPNLNTDFHHAIDLNSSSSSVDVPDYFDQSDSSAKDFSVEEVERTPTPSPDPLPNATPIMFKPPDPKNYPKIPPRSDRLDAPPPPPAPPIVSAKELKKIAYTPTEEQTKLLTGGVTFQSYNRKGKSYPRWVAISPDFVNIIWKDEKKRENRISFNDITVIKRGFATQATKSKKPKTG